MLRQTYDAKIICDHGDKITALVSGSDFCSEHEIGIVPVLQRLCSQYESKEHIVSKLKQKETLSGKMKNIFSRDASIPSILEQRKIDINTDKIHFVEDTRKGIDYAWLYYNVNARGDDLSSIIRNSVDLPCKAYQKEITAAWSDHGFVFCVTGENNIRKLKAFHQAILDGNVGFGGLWFERNELMSGIIIIDFTAITQQDLACISKAQAQYESKIRLAVKDDSNELFNEMKQLSGCEMNMHISPRWADEQESSIVYWVNPISQRLQIEFGGPYDRESLLKWAAARCCYRLEPKE